MDTNIIEEHLKICDKYSAKYTPADPGLLVGISDNTNGKIVLTGIRYNAQRV